MRDDIIVSIQIDYLPLQPTYALQCPALIKRWQAVLGKTGASIAKNLPISDVGLSNENNFTFRSIAYKLPSILLSSQGGL